MDFQKIFEALTGYPPLRWQERLYQRLLAGNLPNVCDLPTGLGKTSVIVIWLIAFAAQIEAGQPQKLPRRLIYIVNRRTVVDQATEIVGKLRERIEESNKFTGEANNPLEWLRTNLDKARVTSRGPVLAISTLRGELADNEEWKSDPARPAIVIGTIDMVGSKLLFSGYGDNYKERPHHAGLVGQDTLIIHDEAHLTPAFSNLLLAIKAEQRHCQEGRPIGILELSATASNASERKVFGLLPEDERDELVKQRLYAQKSLHIHEGEDENVSLQEKIAPLAIKHKDKACKVLVYVRSPEMAQRVVALLEKEVVKEQVDLLTGTIRGYERDRMVKEKPIYRAFLDSDTAVEQTLYLVSTSAGEVGIDLDADHLVCDLTTLDAMIQRLGRVNRRGGNGRIAQVDVVIAPAKKDNKKDTEEKPFEKAVVNTQAALKQLPLREDGGYDASPLALRKLLAESTNAVAPKPPTAPLTDILLDGWSLTTLHKRLPGQPEVAAYLHGLEDNQPETYIAWRTEVPWLVELNDTEILQEWFKHCRIEARERLRDTSQRVLKELTAIAERHDHGNLRVIVLTERGEPETCLLRDILSIPKIAYRTVVLPIEAGGLTDKGLLSGNKGQPVRDVAEEGGERQRQRLLLRQVGDTYRHEPVTGSATERAQDDSAAPTYSSPKKAATAIAKQLRLSLSQLVALDPTSENGDDETEQRFLLLLVKPQRAAIEMPESVNFSKQPTVDEHCQLAEQWATCFAEKLVLSDLQKQALAIAARWHDRGKARRIWQQAIFNDSEIPYAKSGSSGMDGRKLNGYRHEFGSLLEALEAQEIINHPEADLILHLIAVHHGWARPHFLPAAWDVERSDDQNQQAALEVMRRFARVQQRFGRWGLTWLECLIRCTDILASHPDSDSPTKEART